MTNKNYRNGRAKEYRVMKKMKELYPNAICLRSAGSHSLVDIVVIDGETQSVKLIQCKPRSMSKQAKTQIEREIFNTVFPKVVKNKNFVVTVEVI